MKREAFSHTKMKRLCRRLDVPQWQGVGLLESIWNLTARETPRGDIGRLSDEDIALGIDYRGDESKMIDALVVSGWVDRSDTDRLIVHDWDEHAPDGVHMHLARSCARFCTGKPPKYQRLTGKERDRAHEYYNRAHDMHTEGAQKTYSCALPLPLPIPLPEPLPVTEVLPDKEHLPTSVDSAPDVAGVLVLTPDEPKSLTASEKQKIWFDTVFWEEYPLKKARDRAFKACQKHLKGVRVLEVMVGLRAQLPGMLALKETDPSRIPHASTWIAGKRWKDEVLPFPIGPKLVTRADSRMSRIEEAMIAGRIESCGD